MHVSFDTKSRKILSLRITDERVRDHKMFKELVEDALEKCNVYRVLADKGCDTRDSFKEDIYILNPQQHNHEQSFQPHTHPTQP